jgi:hypothetical protein
MALPKLNYPTFDLTLPSTKQELKMRPFLVKEEKILLIAQQTEEAREVINAIKQVINNCVITEGFDIDSLTTFDLEYLFLKLRARSVNNIIKLTYRDNEDDKSYTLECNLDDIQMEYNPDHTNVIKVNDEISIVMKYPEARLMQSLSPDLSESEVFFELLSNCIDVIVENNNSFKVSEASKEELDEFIADLDVTTFQHIQEFFQTMPRIKHELKYVNSLGNERTIVLDNLNDFFTLG